MTADYDPARFLQSIELFADACASPSSFRERVGAGRDLSAGSRILKHRQEVERVRASLAADEQRDAHRDAPSPRRVPNTPRNV